MPDALLTPSQKFEEEARLWEETGKLGWSGQNEYAWVKLRCWSWSDGAKREGISERLKRYVAASEAPFKQFGANWYEDFLQAWDVCGVCGRNDRLEDLSFCTDCDFLHCYRHLTSRAANGNRKCPRCETGELVG
jgi:hypothetical protein